VTLNADSLDKATLDSTLSVLLKHESDLQRAPAVVQPLHADRATANNSLGSPRWQN
jgi:hypothetical protein